MTKKQNGQLILYLPDSPNVGAAMATSDAHRHDSRQEDDRADGLALKVATGDELSAYEKVAGRGVPRP